MAEKGTMTATLEQTLAAWKLLAGEPAECIVVNPAPAVLEVRFKDGEVMRYPQDIRERIVRCRDCAKSELRGRRLYCKAPMGHVGYAEVREDDFCSCGEPREAGE